MRFTFDVTLTVSAVLTSLSVVPPGPFALAPGDVQVVTVVGKDQDGNSVPVTVTGAFSDLPLVSATASGGQVTITGLTGPVGVHAATVSGDAS